LRTHYLRLFSICGLFCISCLLSPSRAESDSNDLDHRGAPVVFQVSTLDALRLGLYQGVYTLSALRHQGDFGLGTFEGIDGEMTILNGHFYHFRSDGVLTEEPDSSRIPFAVITTFHSGSVFRRTVRPWTNWANRSINISHPGIFFMQSEFMVLFLS
jgi:alpha-acetolactate decarboxylase